MSETPVGGVPNSVYFYPGIFLTIWEAIAIGFFLKIYLPKHYNSNFYFDGYKNDTNLLLLPIVACLVLILLQPEVLGGFNFVLSLSEEDIEDDFESKSFFFTLAFIAVRVLKIILPIYLISKVLKSKKDSNNKLNFYYCLSVFVLFYAFIIEGNSRNSILIPAVAMLFSLLFLFPKRKKSTLLLCVSVILLAAVISTIWKVTQVAGIIDHLQYSNSELSYQTSYLEIYFAGISNMGKAIAAYQYTDSMFNISCIWHDLLKNVPILSSLTDPLHTSDYYFATIWQRKDQVIPMTGNGIIYFGYLLGPLLPIFTIKLAWMFENKVYRSNNIVSLVILVYSTAVISYNIFNSIASLTMKLSVIILPLLLIDNFAKNKKSNIYDKRKIN